MKLLCHAAHRIPLDDATGGFYETAAAAVVKLTSFLTEFAPSHLEVIDTFECKVDHFTEGVGPVFVLNLVLDRSATEVRLTWKQIFRKVRNPTADEVVLTFTTIGAEMGSSTRYAGSLLASGISDLVKYSEEMSRDRKDLLQRIRSMQ